MKSPQEVKRDIPFLRHYTYWDSSAVGPTLSSVIESMVEYYEHRPLNYSPSFCRPAFEANDQVKKAIESVARLIDVRPEEVSVYPKNTTEAISMVIQGLPFKEGDEIIGTNVDHLASYLPILRLMKQRGIKFQLIKADPHGWIDVKEFKKLITKKTRLIIVCHASNIYGTILNAKAICALARENGVLTMVDAAQTVGRMPVDAGEIGCDFLNFCGRKHLCGPQGTAALYIRRELIEKLDPVVIGAGAATLTSDFEYKLYPGMKRYEAGILNTSGVIGLGAALDYWLEIGMETVRRHCADMQDYLFQGLEELNCIIYSPKKRETQVGVIGFRVKGVDPDFLVQELDNNYKIIVRSSSLGSPVFNELGVKKINRLAPHYYLTKDDADQLIRAIKRIRGKAKSQKNLSGL